MILRRGRPASLLLAATLAAALPATAAATSTIVVCAPGMPGDTAQAQPTMDAFARSVEAAAEFRPGSVRAVYLETEAAGVARLAEQDALLALVTAPFLAKHGQELSLTPRLAVVSEGGSASEAWSLVAQRGAVGAPAALDGFEITGIPGYAPRFVREVLLGGFGDVSEGARITFSSRVASALLKAASGQKLAVLLDAEQAKALPSHPRAADLEVVATSQPVPGSLVCTVGGRAAKNAERLLQALLKLQERPGGAEVLASLRTSRFEPADRAAVERALSGRAQPASGGK